MAQISGSNPIAERIAITLAKGINNHYRLFREKSRKAKVRFEKHEWQVIQRTVRYRIQFYGTRVGETSAYRQKIFAPLALGA